MSDENMLNLLESLVIADSKTNELFMSMLKRIAELERLVSVLYELKRIGEI